MCFGLSNPYFALRFASISGGSRRWLENGLPGAICTMMKVMVRTMRTIGSISSKRRNANRVMALSPFGFPVGIDPGVFEGMFLKQVGYKPPHIGLLKPRESV